MSTTTNSVPSGQAPRRIPKGYVPALGPKLKIILAIVFGSVAILGATGVYLAAISLLNWAQAPQTFTNPFTLWMFIGHSVVGVAAMVPFVLFGGVHLVTSRKRPNKRAVKLGMIVFALGLIVGITGLSLIQLEGLPQLPTGTVTRSIAYWLHILLPIAAIVGYVLHRQAGPDIQWKWGIAWASGVGVFVVAMIALHSQDPRKWYAVGSAEGEQYFHPSAARTSDGNFIPADVLMMDEYCMKCHQDVYNDHIHSAHKFSSFNNPPYLFSVRETRKVSLERDGNVKAARWCAGCHDPVPFFSGAFDNPNYDDVNDKTAHAGITCTACHAMTHVNSTKGNADYTIEEPEHYPLAFSDNPWLQWVNNQVIKAKPDFHKKTFLKPFHKTAEFCSTCHKVSLPVELNHYKDFLRGQNHYDSFLLSGVSGHGVRSFYYPPEAKVNCAECHMPLKPSMDFGSRDFDGTGIRKRHDHLFPGANTGLFELLKFTDRYKDRAAKFDESIRKNTDYLTGVDPEGKDKKLRIDLFGLKEGGSIDGKLIAPLRPTIPALKPGQTYLVEAVVRTLGVGHHFSQGTVDSNEIWVDFEAKVGDRVIARNGATGNPDDTGPVDPWAHFINVHMLDRNGNRIDRRNPQDIFTPLYDHQIPPGGAAVVHYQLDIPKDVQGEVQITARVRYRKFDYSYMKYVHGNQPVPKLPIVDMCSDKLALPIGDAPKPTVAASPIPAWQRWNDYGIGCLLEGGMGSKKGEFRQAEEAFRQLLNIGEKSAVGQGHLNMARVYLEEGRLQEAAQALTAAKQSDPAPPWWTIAWFAGLIDTENATEAADFEKAIATFESILDPNNQPTTRKFDFQKDYVVWNRLGTTLFKRSQLSPQGSAEEAGYLNRAIAAFNRVLTLDSEDLDAHYGLSQCYARLGLAALDLPTPTEIAGSPDIAELTAGAETLAKPDLAEDVLLAHIGRLVERVTQFGRLPNQADRPRLPVLGKLILAANGRFQTATTPTTRAALAHLLATLHRETHAIYRPDEHARARTTAAYRLKNPAANHAAEAIVIYPTTVEQKQAIVARQPRAAR
ncbi:tetratricopeptide repeat protein [Tuwongella immobilis]|uniref:Cytochrome c-552/4 domain-containing protein n=1 Tax=Tuwongella immobilis TaxID=692036 RepID=A0A6C2YNS0_9BACT|nr:tetratricopeptide repeat protein [Tuwongella immobilis]VIP02532.1 tetratricopeptide tpr_2 repeat protein : Uncharacterized protein OS=Singulisphaera acidiphila (strain ATCC BAA-1392 / DSM 18658 / VKM B-2454 / MOB10) GN=Sinac_4942 PE=4 SV=1: Cytochrome_C554: TPR_11 [Tuwongella immobilis]VTS01685.1 tetratricopeptide tpr_2 repeat protein : Uncharacterized protein OS=Singulisphaera acidiphila (strain ATCC BAA-1392 / DSM 18658 / VKM B-2454 / MOB10) GN=Sinac_4942 PE=4 SV=1: Cytochrome_C554: TPR_11 [